MSHGSPRSGIRRTSRPPSSSTRSPRTSTPASSASTAKTFVTGAPSRGQVRQRSRAGKQVVLLAAGGSEAGARAAASHTGALASDAAAVEAACRASGILGVATPKQLVDRALASARASPSPREEGRDRGRRRRYRGGHGRSRYAGGARAAPAVDRARGAADGASRPASSRRIPSTWPGRASRTSGTSSASTARCSSRARSTRSSSPATSAATAR